VRPPRKILLVGDDEERIGVLRYLLRTYKYAVITASSPAEAAELLCQPIDVLLLEWPLDGAEDLLNRSKEISPATNTLVVTDEDRLPVGVTPDSTLFRRSLRSNAEILDRIMVLAARKRGPRPDRV